ncbi:MAG: hypothetical protein WBM36_05010 [Lysobacterales bacterium]
MSTRLFLVLLLILTVPALVGAYETDQFNNRQQDIKDSTSILNQQVTLAIAGVIVGLGNEPRERKVVDGIYYKIGGKHWVDKLERFAMDSSEVEKLTTPPHDSIYSGHPFYATRVAGLFGVGPTLKINGVLVGTDKLGHFLSQGRKFYRRWVKLQDESKAAEHSAYTERAIFGQMTTGSYSNADLVANFEGYRFYRSLFEDNIVPGKPAILTWEGDHWIMQRPFDWADHVNDYWDEALNINHYDTLLYTHMKTRLLTFCDSYQANPELYEVHDEEALKNRYRYLQLRETSELRLSQLCTSGQDNQVITASQAGDSQ